jgi:RHS repeat-associated protein
MAQSAGGLGLNLPWLKATVEYEGDMKAYRQDDWDGSWTTTKTFNNRLQPVTIQSIQEFSGTPPPVCGVSAIYSSGCCYSKLDLSYSFTDASGHNNGNVVSILNNLNWERDEFFSYDSLNRLSTAYTASTNKPAFQGDNNFANCWGEQYTYDPWGNFTAISASSYTGCNQENLNMLATTQNQLQDLNNDYVYDSAGNLTQPGPTGGTYVYDAENQLTSAAGVTYTYDGDGNRVMKSNGTIYWYGANSASLEESDLSGNIQRSYFFFNGQRIGRTLPTNEVGFYMTDHLGNVRYLGGSATGYSIDYYPFGGIIVNSDTGDDRYQFTGKERDSESGLDNFGARYDSSAMGRFMSPDWSAAPMGVPYADFANPQSLNLYGYVKNNPLNLTDPDGHCCAPYEAADWIDSKINAAVDYIDTKAIATGNPSIAQEVATDAGFTGDVAKGFTNLLRTGQSVGSLPENASAGQIAIAVAEEGGRVGGTILAVVAVAGPSTPATPEQGASVRAQTPGARVTLKDGSAVDLTGRSHGGVPTPHIKSLESNTDPASGMTYQKFGPVTPATLGDVNAAAKTAGVTPPVRIPPPVPVPQPKRENQ